MALSNQDSIDQSDLEQSSFNGLVQVKLTHPKFKKYSDRLNFIFIVGLRLRSALVLG
jgi:hypothetical protein